MSDSPSNFIGRRPDARFATTRWSLVLHAAAGADQSKQALGDLIQTSWYPLYAFCRRRGNNASATAC